MTPWNLNETYDLVRRLFGSEQEMLTRQSARSVADRQAFCRYHFNEAMRLSKAFEKNHLSTGTTIFEMHVAGEEKTQQAFEVFMIKAGAHSLAAIQSLHAIPDLFGHAIYFASGQNLQPHALNDSDVTLPRVIACLEKDNRFAPLSRSLASIQSGAGWNHLAAVSNMGKHRGIVRAAYNEDLTGTRSTRRELHVSAFERRGKSYPSTSLRDLLEPEFERVSKSAIDVAHELNACLRTA